MCEVFIVTFAPALPGTAGAAASCESGVVLGGVEYGDAKVGVLREEPAFEGSREDSGLEKSKEPTLGS